MARKIVFTKEYILERTYEFIKRNGLNFLNARELCKFIGCSTQPLFKNFETMESLKQEVKLYLRSYYEDFIDEFVKPEDYLYTISYAYATFAYREPNVFKALFMSDLAGQRTIEEVLATKRNLKTIDSIPVQYGLTKENAKKLYRDVRFYTHGLSCQIACQSIIVTETEIKKLIKDMIKKLKDVI